MSKKYFFGILFITINAFSQINSPNGSNIFSYNGAADVTFKYASRGSGGRALVHFENNILALNFAGDFTGGTLIGNDVFFKDGGNSYIASGNVGIGTRNPTSKLTVAGNINSREVKVTVDAGADFVFENDYNLPSLDSVNKYIKENKHLPEIASASEMQKDGINLSEMNIKLLQKVEELTLYAIAQQINVEKLTKIIEELSTRLQVLESK